jgi:hypothetical protein
MRLEAFRGVPDFLWWLMAPEQFVLIVGQARGYGVESTP